jgi:hypothetical protein
MYVIEIQGKYLLARVVDACSTIHLTSFPYILNVRQGCVQNS